MMVVVRDWIREAGKFKSAMGCYDGEYGRSNPNGKYQGMRLHKNSAQGQRDYIDNKMFHGMCIHAYINIFL